MVLGSWNTELLPTTNVHHKSTTMNVVNRYKVQGYVPLTVFLKDTAKTVKWMIEEGRYIDVLPMFKQWIANQWFDVEMALDDDGQTPLICAVQNDKLMLADFLLSNGADPDGVDKYNRSPIYFARTQRMRDWTSIHCNYLKCQQYYDDETQLF